MTLQEIFDKAYLGLESQDFRRAHNGTSCCYRTPDGENKCAVGHLIPDDEYDPTIEGKGVSSGYPVIQQLLDTLGVEYESEDHDLMVALQSAHDMNVYPDCMKAQFKHIANRRNLRVPQ